MKTSTYKSQFHEQIQTNVSLERPVRYHIHLHHKTCQSQIPSDNINSSVNRYIWQIHRFPATFYSTAVTPPYNHS